jgi:hypothetical protein
MPPVVLAAVSDSLITLNSSVEALNGYPADRLSRVNSLSGLNRLKVSSVYLNSSCVLFKALSPVWTNESGTQSINPTSVFMLRKELDSSFSFSMVMSLWLLQLEAEEELQLEAV